MSDFFIDGRSYGVERAGGVLSANVLADAELAIGATLPAELRNFMLRFNGGLPYPEDIPESVSIHVRLRWNDGSPAIKYGRSANLERVYRVEGEPAVDLVRANRDFRGRIPEDTITFGYDAGGNQFLIGIGEKNRGKIFFWAKWWEADRDAGQMPSHDNVAVVADSFLHFLKGMSPEPLKDESYEDWEKRCFHA
jgi:hypothetical protein